MASSGYCNICASRTGLATGCAGSCPLCVNSLSNYLAACAYNFTALNYQSLQTFTKQLPSGSDCVPLFAQASRAFASAYCSDAFDHVVSFSQARPHTRQLPIHPLLLYLLDFFTVLRTVRSLTVWMLSSSRLSGVAVAAVAVRGPRSGVDVSVDRIVRSGASVRGPRPAVHWSISRSFGGRSVGSVDDYADLFALAPFASSASSVLALTHADRPIPLCRRPLTHLWW